MFCMPANLGHSQCEGCVLVTIEGRDVVLVFSARFSPAFKVFVLQDTDLVFSATVILFLATHIDEVICTCKLKILSFRPHSVLFPASLILFSATGIFLSATHTLFGRCRLNS